jgi:hypothetical protein
MLRITLGVLTLGVFSVSVVLAAAVPPTKPAGAAAAPAKAAVPVDQQKAAEVEALVTAGKYDEAIEAGTKLLAAVRDAEAKTSLSKSIADSTRKKGDWSRAAGAYTRLRECYQKNSDDWVKYDAAVSVMQSSPKGVYAPTTPGAPSTAEPPKPLTDDAALADALARFGVIRMKALQTRAAGFRACRMPQDVLTSLKASAEDIRRILIYSPEAPFDVPHEIGTAASERLKEQGVQLTAVLKAKYQIIKPKANTPWVYTNVEKEDIALTNTQCTALAEVEKGFRDCLDALKGKGDWKDLDKINEASRDREQSYTQFAAQFVVQPYDYRIIF